MVHCVQYLLCLKT